MDLMQAISPKSDQLNADDLIAGPKVITITEVKLVAGDQPVIVHYDGDNGKPWKPCKSMARVMVKAWGADAKVFAGRSLQLYNDPSVKWAGVAVGGIRIAAMSHIEQPFTMNLTATRGKRAPFRVEVLTQQPGGQDDDLAASLRAKFEECASIDEVRALWEQLPPMVRETAAAFKDEAKQRLQGDK